MAAGKKTVTKYARRRYYRRYRSVANRYFPCRVEGFAAILWKDGKRAAEAAEVMKITAHDLEEAGIVEKVIPEQEDFHCNCMRETAGLLKREILDFMRRYQGMTPEELREQRYGRFRRMG